MTRLAAALPLLLMIPACAGLRAGAGSVAPVGGAAVASDPSTVGAGNAVGSAGGAGTRAGGDAVAAVQSGLANVSVQTAVPWAVALIVGAQTVLILRLTGKIVWLSHLREMRRIDARTAA